MVPVMVDGEDVDFIPFNIFANAADCLSAVKRLFDRYELELRKNNGTFYWAVRVRCGEGFIEGSADTLEQAVGAACAEVIEDE